MASHDHGQRTTYVVGGYLPQGGTYMAYHLGHILSRHFGFACKIVSLDGESVESQTWEYPSPYPIVTLSDMVTTITDGDVLVANPSFSDFLFGLSLPGRKLMYVQDFKTFAVLDGFFDGYVSVSPFVQRFLAQTYGIDTPVIPAFLELDHIQANRPWLDRPRHQILVTGKYAFGDLLKRFATTMDRCYPALDLQLNPVTTPLSHRALVAAMGAHRYFLTLTPCEGFGLLPLEAMACGCTVLGFHGNGGLAYMTDGHNCAVVGYPNMDALCTKLASAVSNESFGLQLANTGKSTSLQYSYAKFEATWIDYLANFLSRKRTA